MTRCADSKSRPAHAPRTLFCLLCCLLLAPGATAATGPEAMLRALSEVYRSEPRAERVHIEVEGPAGTASSEIIVRIAAGEGTEPDRVRIELGPLIVFAQSDGVTGFAEAVHEGDTSAFVRWNFEGPLTSSAIAAIMPPTPIPQAELAFDADTRLLRNMLPGVRWHAASERSVSGHESVVFGRTADGGSATVRIDNRSGRLSRMEASWPSPDGAISLRLRAETIEPGRPESWRTPTDGRRRLSSIAGLRPSPSDIRPGDPFPDLHLQTESFQPWTLAGELGEGAARTLVLVCFRAGPPGDQREQARIDTLRIDEVRTAIAASARAGAALGDGQMRTRVLGVFDLSGFSAERLGAIASRIRGEPSQRELLWAVSSRLTIDRFAPGSHASIAVIDPSGDLAGVIELTGRAGQEAEIAQEIARAASGRRGAGR